MSPALLKARWETIAGKCWKTLLRRKVTGKFIYVCVLYTLKLPGSETRPRADGSRSDAALLLFVYPASAKVKNSLKDNELLNMFTKMQSLSNKQQDTVKDLISAFILKADLQKNLSAK